MFKVDVGSSREYLSFDPARKSELKKLDALIRGTVPKLTPHFHAGTPAGEAGMRMKMLGYGKSTRRKREKRRLGRLSASPCKEAISASILPCGETECR